MTAPEPSLLVLGATGSAGLYARIGDDLPRLPGRPTTSQLEGLRAT